jgi:hypothetical protein
VADKIIDVQLKFSGGIPQPVVTGDRRLTLLNLAKLIWSLNHGSAYKGGAGYLQVQTSVVAASATATCAAVQANDTVTIAGTALTATQRRATGTITCSTALAGQTITVNGVEFTGTAGAVTLGEATFSIDTGNTETATSIAAQINGYASPLISGIVAAKSSSAVVTLYAVTQGTAGNAITLASSDGGTLAVSGAVLANGAALTNNTFDFAATNALTGDALAAAINASTTAAVKQVTATSDGAGIVTVTSKVGGIAGNGLTFVSSNGTRLAVTGSGYLADGSASAVTRWTL